MRSIMHSVPKQSRQAKAIRMKLHQYSKNIQKDERRNWKEESRKEDRKKKETKKEAKKDRKDIVNGKNDPTPSHIGRKYWKRCNSTIRIMIKSPLAKVRQASPSTDSAINVPPTAIPSTPKVERSPKPNCIVTPIGRANCVDGSSPCM